MILAEPVLPAWIQFCFMPFTSSSTPTWESWEIVHGTLEKSYRLQLRGNPWILSPWSADSLFCIFPNMFSIAVADLSWTSHTRKSLLEMTDMQIFFTSQCCWLNSRCEFPQLVASSGILGCDFQIYPLVVEHQYQTWLGNPWTKWTFQLDMVLFSGFKVHCDHDFLISLLSEKDVPIWYALTNVA